MAQDDQVTIDREVVKKILQWARMANYYNRRAATEAVGRQMYKIINALEGCVDDERE